MYCTACYSGLKVGPVLKSYPFGLKEMSFCQKFWFSNPYIFAVWCCKPLMFQTIIIWSKRIHSLKYQRSSTLNYKEIGIRKLEFVAKTQFQSLHLYLITYIVYKDIFKYLKRRKNGILAFLCSNASRPSTYSNLLYSCYAIFLDSVGKIY